MDYSFLDQLDMNAYAIDKDLTLLHINKKAAKRYKNAAELPGNSVFNCHKKEKTKARIAEMRDEFAAGRKEPFVYTLPIGKKTKQKVIMPFFKDGVFDGILELSFDIEGK